MKNIICQRTGKIDSLTGSSASGERNIVFQSICHWYLDNLKEVFSRLKIGKCSVDSVKEYYFTVYKPVAEFFDFISTFGYGIDHGKGKGQIKFLYLFQKPGNIQFEADTVGWFGAVSEDLAVHGALP